MVLHAENLEYENIVLEYEHSSETVSRTDRVINRVAMVDEVQNKPVEATWWTKTRVAREYADSIFDKCYKNLTTK